MSFNIIFENKITSNFFEFTVSFMKQGIYSLDVENCQFK